MTKRKPPYQTNYLYCILISPIQHALTHTNTHTLKDQDISDFGLFYRLLRRRFELTLERNNKINIPDRFVTFKL